MDSRLRTSRRIFLRTAVVMAAAGGGGLLLQACAGATPTPTAESATTTTSSAAQPTAKPGPTQEPSKPAPAATIPHPQVATGEIVIAFEGQNTYTWEKMAEAYMQKHPGVKVLVELKPAQGYQEWIRAQFSTGVPKASLMNNNVVADLVLAKKFLNLDTYLDKISPYTGKPWREDIDERALQNMRDPITGEMYTLNLETVQVRWFYNKDAFQKAGITDVPDQPTWSQLIQWCERLKQAGYIPLAIEGDYTAFWEVRVGWLARIYADQYTRKEAELVRAQPGDWDFRAGIDDKWKLDLSDPWNDDNNKVTFNLVRKMIAFRDHKQAVDSPEWKELYSNLKQLLGQHVPPGFTGIADAYPLFLTQKAAMRLDGAWFISTFEKDIKSLAEGTYGRVTPGTPTPTPVPGAREAKIFEYGTFNMPTMDTSLVQAKARTIEVNIGFWGVPKKDQEQNDLEVDFLMFVTSPEGYRLYLDATLDPNNPAGRISGPPVVKNAKLPERLAEKLGGLKFIGNCEKDTAGTYRARGIADYQPSVREWVDLAQQYFTDRISLDDFVTSYQKSLNRLFPEILKHLRLEPSDLEHPEKKPPERS